MGRSYPEELLTKIKSLRFMVIVMAAITLLTVLGIPWAILYAFLAISLKKGREPNKLLIQTAFIVTIPLCIFIAPIFLEIGLYKLFHRMNDFDTDGKQAFKSNKEWQQLRFGRKYILPISLVASLLLIIVMALPIPITLTNIKTIPFTAQDVESASLELGQTQTTQSGVDGKDVVRTSSTTPLFAYIFGFKTASYITNAPKTTIVKQPINQLIAQGTKKYQYMWCSNGSYRYYTNSQFSSPDVGFTHESPDDCAKNNEGKETQLANSPPATKPANPSSNLINTTTPTIPDCTTTSIPYGIDYQNASWLPTGQTQTEPGLDGTYFSCLGTTVQPINEIIYTGTGINYDTVNQQEVQQAAREKCQQEYQSAMAQIDAAGAGDSSATVEVQQLYQQCLNAAG